MTKHEDGATLNGVALSDLLYAGYKKAGFARHNHTFKEGQKVRTRGDIGSFNLTIVKIHNDHYCTVRGYGKDRHMNLAFIEPYNDGV